MSLSATEADPRLDLVTALEAVAPHASLGDRATIIIEPDFIAIVRNADGRY